MQRSLVDIPKEVQTAVLSDLMQLKLSMNEIARKHDLRLGILDLIAEDQGLDLKLRIRLLELKRTIDNLQERFEREVLYFRQGGILAP